MATHSSILAWRILKDRGASWATVHKAAKSRTQLTKHISDIAWSFSVRLTSLSMFISSPCCCKWHYFNIFNSWVIVPCIYVPHLLYPFICWRTFRLSVLAIINSAAINTGVHVPFLIIVFSGHMPRSGIIGSCGNASFSFLRNLHIGYINLYPHQQCRRVPFSLHALWYSYL